MMMESSCTNQHNVPKTESSQKPENQKLTTKRRRRSAGVGVFLTQFDSNVDLLEDENQSTLPRYKSKRLENRARNITFTESATTVNKDTPQDDHYGIHNPNKTNFEVKREATYSLGQNNGGLLRSNPKFTQRSVTSSTSSVASENEMLHRSQNKIFYEKDIVADTTHQSNLNCSQLQQRSPALVISADSLNERCVELFGCTEPGATSNVTAKILAYATLLIDPELYSVLLSPSFLSVLASFVHMETTLSKYNEHCSVEVSNNDNFESTKTGRRVRFCPFSSISPPVDNSYGSHLTQEHCIEALRSAVEKVDSLCLMLEDAEIERQRVLQCLEMLSLSLRTIEESSQRCLFMQTFTSVDEKGSINTICPSQPNASKVAYIFRMELDSMHTFFRNKIKLDTNPTVFQTSPIRKQFVEQVGAAIRFHLRRLLNPVPVTATNTESTKFPQTMADYSNCRSRVHRLVQMVANCNKLDSAAADGSISSVFNLAVQYIYSYFDFRSNTILSSETANTQSSSIDAIKTCKPDITKTSSLFVFPAQFDPSPIVHSVMTLQNVLATGKACKFIVDLLNWPGVLDAIHDVGGWGPVETLSALLSKHHLDRICPEYAHFRILDNMNLFLETLNVSMSYIEETIDAAEKTLRTIWDHFKCGNKQKSWLKRHPFVVIVRDAILENPVVFPRLESVKE